MLYEVITMYIPYTGELVVFIGAFIGALVGFMWYNSYRITSYNVCYTKLLRRHSEITAAHLVNCYTADELTRIFRVYGELKNAAKVAHLLVEHRTKASLQTVGDLQEALRKVTPRWGDHQFYAQVFQALRIEVNHEIDYLRSMLTQATEILAPGGRLSIISYHSLEDRVVKNFFRTGSFDTGSTETDLFGNILRPLTPVNNKVIVPDQKELELNNRARSARLRIAEKQEHGEYDRAG